MQMNYVNRKPIGVAGLITPWNTPFMLESWKLAPALASGMHGRAQARRVHAAVGEPVGGDLPRGGAAATVSSTSSTDSARRPATRW